MAVSVEGSVGRSVNVARQWGRCFELRPPRNLSGSLQTPPHPGYSRSATVGFRFSSRLLSFRVLCLSDMSMLFCSWAKKEEEADDDQDVDDEEEKSDSKQTEEVEENSEEVSEKEEPSEDSKEEEAGPSKKPAEAAPAFFCKWATEEEEYKSDSEQDSENEAAGENKEDKSEAVDANDTGEAELEEEEEKAEEAPLPPEPVKEDKPVIFCKWGDHAEYESSEEEEEEEDKRLEEDAKLEPESEEEDKTLDNAPAAEDSGGWMVRMVEDATNDLLNLPLAPESNSDAQDPFDSVFSSSRATRTAQRKASRTTNNYGSDSDAGDNYIPDVDTSNFEVIDDWDDYVADTIEGNEKEEREAATKRTTRNKAGRKPGPKSMKPGPKSMKPGPKSKSVPKSHNVGPKSARPGPASRRSRRRSSSEASGDNLDLSSIRLNKRNDVGVTAAERKLANKHMVVEKDEDEEEDMPLARRRKSGGSRKRKGEGDERARTKKARTDAGENRRSSRDSEVGWPRLSSVFDNGEDGRRVRKPTAKVQPFVHVEPEKEKRRVRPKDRSRTGGVPTKKRVHQPAKGPYFTACKIGSYRCPLCFTQWQLNQPYGRHIIAQACQVS